MRSAIVRHLSALQRRAGSLGAAWQRRVDRGDDGFILLESVIAIALITFIMGAVGAEYVNGLATTNQNRLDAVAVQIADSQMDQIRALHPSDLTTGRGRSAVDAERSDVAKFTSVQPATYEAFDATAAATSTGTNLSTTAIPTTVGAVTYSVYRYFECTSVPSSAGSCVTAVSTSTSTAPPANGLRAVVLVTWPEQGCPAVKTSTMSAATPTCRYTTSSVINDDSDPTFDLNQPLPPSPVVAGPTTITVAGNDAVSYQLAVQDNGGVPPFTWSITAGSLPTGLTMDTTGLVTGTVSPLATSTTVTVTVMDAYLRSASATLTWTVERAPAIAPVNDQSNAVGDAANVSLIATGGGGANYTFSDSRSTLPPGLSVSTAGVITGKITRESNATYPKTYHVSITAADPQSCPACVTTPRTATVAFNWTVSLAPLGLSNPGSQAWTVNTALNTSTAVQLTASGGDGNYAFSATGLPAGLSIGTASGALSGTPTGTGSGTINVTVSDTIGGQVLTKTVSFAWTVYSKPTVTTPGAQSTTAGGTASLAVSASCADTPCTFTATGLPTGLAINAQTGVISGTVATNANQSNTARVTVTDRAGASATSGTFSWTVVTAPTISGTLGTKKFTRTAVESVSLSYTCPTTSCRLTLNGSVPGLGLTTSSTASTDLTSSTSLTVSSASGTVYVGGKVQTSAVTGSAYQPVVTITTTSDGSSASTAPGSWTVYAPPSVATPAQQVTALGASPALTFSGSCPNAPCSYTMQNAPAGLSVNASGAVTGSTTGSSGWYSGVTVTITDNDHVSTTSSSFRWAVTTTLSAAANNIGITKSSNISAGLFDRVGGNSSSDHHSFSYENMTRVGSSSAVTAGQQLSINGDTYLWPTTAGTGSPDNVVAQGQVIAYSGSGMSNIGFIVGTQNGNFRGTVTIGYTDGTTTDATLSATDWVTSSSSAALTSKENMQAAGSSSTSTSGTVNLYEQEATLNTAKQVAFIVLPNSSANPYLHVFAISQPPLASAFNDFGIATISNRNKGNLDGNGYSLDYEAITGNGGPEAGATVSAGGLTYQWPAAAGTGSSDNVASSGQTIPFSATGSNTLGFLVTGVNGSLTATGGKVTYSDGTTTAFSLSAGDWCTQTGGPYSVAFTGTARYSQSGIDTRTVYVNYTTVSVTASKTIKSITLPSSSGSTNLHIFAIGYGS
jgi:type II secretory pathway pseudopilin PulG